MARKGPVLLLCLSIFVATGALPMRVPEKHEDSTAQPVRPVHAGSGDLYPGTVALGTPQSSAPPTASEEPPTTSAGAPSPTPIPEGPTGTLPRPGDHLPSGPPFERPFPGGFLPGGPLPMEPFPDRPFSVGPSPDGLGRRPYQAEPFPRGPLLGGPYPGEPLTGGPVSVGSLPAEPFREGGFPGEQHPEGPFLREQFPRGPLPVAPFTGESFPQGQLPMGPFPVRTFPQRPFSEGPSRAGTPFEGSFPSGPFSGSPLQDAVARPHIAGPQEEETQEKTPAHLFRPGGEPGPPAQGGATITNVIHNKNTAPSYFPFQQTWRSFFPPKFPFRGRHSFPLHYGSPFSRGVFPHFTTNFCNCAMGSRCVVSCSYSPHYKFSY